MLKPSLPGAGLPALASGIASDINGDFVPHGTVGQPHLPDRFPPGRADRPLSFSRAARTGATDVDATGSAGGTGTRNLWTTELAAEVVDKPTEGRLPRMINHTASAPVSGRSPT